MSRKLVITNLLMVVTLFLVACSTAVDARSSTSAKESEDIVAATVAGLETIGWDVHGLTAKTEVIDGNYARVLVNSSNPPGGFTAFLRRQQNGWQVIAHGSAFNPAQLKELGIPNSILPETLRAGEVSVPGLLRSNGGQIEMSGEDVQQPFFSISGEIARLNGQDLQLFTYPTEADALAAAAEVAPDGRSVGTHMMAWMATPHFYRSSPTLVLYVGDDADTLALLEAALGSPFAGGLSE